MEQTGEKKKKRWSKKQLRASQGILTQQAKTNIYASQSGTTGFGSVRHGADIRADDVNKEGEGVLTQQAATHIYASQKGMTGYGSVRHGADIRADNCVPEGHGILTQQAETNIYASQKGMRGYGAVRHGADIRIKELYEEGDDDEYATDEEEVKAPVGGRRIPRTENQAPAVPVKPAPEPEQNGEPEEDAQVEDE